MAMVVATPSQRVRFLNFQSIILIILFRKSIGLLRELFGYFGFPVSKNEDLNLFSYFQVRRQDATPKAAETIEDKLGLPSNSTAIRNNIGTHPILQFVKITSF